MQLLLEAGPRRGAPYEQPPPPITVLCTLVSLHTRISFDTKTANFVALKKTKHFIDLILTLDGWMNSLIAFGISL